MLYYLFLKVGVQESVLVSRYDLLVVRELGHGITRGVMDLERPFQGSFHPPGHQHDTVTSSTVRESQLEQELILKSNELLPPQ